MSDYVQIDVLLILCDFCDYFRSTVYDPTLYYIIIYLNLKIFEKEYKCPVEDKKKKVFETEMKNKTYYKKNRVCFCGQLDTNPRFSANSYTARCDTRLHGLSGVVPVRTYRLVFCGHWTFSRRIK